MAQSYDDMHLYDSQHIDESNHSHFIDPLRLCHFSIATVVIRHVGVPTRKSNICDIITAATDDDVNNVQRPQPWL